jgi:selenoprotein W-related protein
VVEQILGNYQHIIEKLTLITATGGVFDVHVNNELIFSKKALGRHAEDGEILALFEQIIGPDVLKYGT